MQWFRENAVEHIYEVGIGEERKYIVTNDELVQESDINAEKNKLYFINPEDLLSWMKSNISYHSSGRLLSWEEVLEKKSGDCHDQVEFASHFFKDMNLRYGKLFMVEYSKWNSPGGATHSLLYFFKDKSIYWFENAWGDKKGIHGPYNSLVELKNDVFKNWNFSGNNTKLLMSSVKGVKPGIKLNDYVNACLSDIDDEPANVYCKDEPVEETGDRLSPEEVERFYKILKEKLEKNDDMIEYCEEFLESVQGYILKDLIYPNIEKTFKNNPNNIRKFNQLVSQFINRNIDKLTTSGPIHQILFTDRDKSEYFQLFDITAKEIQMTLIEHTRKIDKTSNFLFLRQNPIFPLFYFVIRYFALNPDKKSLNSALSIYALSNYPSMFKKYFKYGVIEPVMQYTIDNLTDKFLIKKSKHIFGALVESISHSYEFLKPYFKDGSDKEVIRFIQRIRNDQNSLFKKIANEYMKNHQSGKAVKTTNQSYDDNTPILDDVNNATIEVQNAVTKVSLPIISNGVDLMRAEASAKMVGIGFTDCRFFLTRILTDKHLKEMEILLESILFLYLYEEKKTIRDIRSQYFLSWGVSLFKKTNSRNENILKINEILNAWAKDSGILDKFQREASRISYKKAIFMYVLLSIQKYIG